MIRGIARVCGLIAVLCGVAVCRPASACSICIAHALSAALHGLGAQTLAHGRLVVGLTYTTFRKTNGTDEPGAVETEHYHETALDVSYGFSDRVTLSGTLPYVDKRIDAPDGSGRASGIGDMVLGATYQLPPTVKGKFLTAFSLDLKLPTGDSHIKDAAGALKEEHLQLGTGSVDMTPGVALTWEGKHFGEVVYSGLRYRLNGANNRGFRYGDVLFYNLGWLRPINMRTSVALEYNGRIAGKDRLDGGSRDPDSGGHLAYLSLSLRQDLGKDYGLVATYQVPVWKQLNGTQDESALFSVSLSKVF